MSVNAKDDFSAATFRMRVAMETGEVDPMGYGDHLLNPDIISRLAGKTLREAAVLVPLVDYGEDPKIILTQRTETMRTHSGQVAFPGGAIDPEDGSPEVAAMREAEEEIGLPRTFVEPVGRLPQYFAPTGFRITPVLAVVRKDYPMTINRHEVEDAFEVPFSFLMDPLNHKRESRIWEGKERHFYTMPYGERYIWGVTAGIIRTLYERLYA
ncbi:MAG: CoA pyrophosphatase [Hyphomicrobiales bacterium]|nr:CoA pyrophosphatase [Hyphomicrobiales bacterium]MCP5000384.1 CoA pyrophosphatase [Hyphomicrobiales bacterium]